MWPVASAAGPFDGFHLVLMSFGQRNCSVVLSCSPSVVVVQDDDGPEAPIAEDGDEEASIQIICQRLQGHTWMTLGTQKAGSGMVVKIFCHVGFWSCITNGDRANGGAVCCMRCKHSSGVAIAEEATGYWLQVILSLMAPPCPKPTFDKGVFTRHYSWRFPVEKEVSEEGWLAHFESFNFKFNFEHGHYCYGTAAQNRVWAFPALLAAIGNLWLTEGP